MFSKVLTISIDYMEVTRTPEEASKEATWARMRNAQLRKFVYRIGGYSTTDPKR
jgi:hypothetical protein